jgi:hypothetical protein
VQQVVELVGRLREARHHLLAREAQHGAHVGRLVQRVDARGVPAARVELLHEAAGLLLHPVGLDHVGALGQAERSPQAGQRAALAAPRLLRAQDAEHEVDARRPPAAARGRAARRG